MNYLPWSFCSNTIFLDLLSIQTSPIYSWTDSSEFLFSVLLSIRYQFFKCDRNWWMKTIFVKINNNKNRHFTFHWKNFKQSNLYIEILSVNLFLHDNLDISCVLKKKTLQFWVCDIRFISNVLKCFVKVCFKCYSQYYMNLFYQSNYLLFMTLSSLPNSICFKHLCNLFFIQLPIYLTSESF